MGLADRDYVRRPSRGRLGAIDLWSITTWLIVINLTVFFLDGLLRRMGDLEFGPLEYWGYFSYATAIYHLQLWRFLTFQFLHLGLMHIGFNMLALYFFGPFVEQSLGRRRYLAYYLLCGIGGGLAYVLLYLCGILIRDPRSELVGASAGIFGVLIAAWKLAPDMDVMWILPPVPMKLRTMVLIFLGIAAYVVLTGGANAGGEAAHLGGAAIGWLLLTDRRWLDWADAIGRPGMRYGGRRVRLRNRPPNYRP